MYRRFVLVFGLALIAITLAASRASEAVDLFRFPLCWLGVLAALWGLRKRPRIDWTGCAVASVLFWDLFELVDLRLKNWWYTGVSPNPLVSATFAAVSFATVLPAVRIVTAGVELPPADHRRLRFAAGVVMLLLALLFPRTAFPLAWLFLWPLCEALSGRRVPLRLAPWGILLGLVWESLNWGCARGWVYTVPHFETLKLFEMPLAGYLGYLPFMLEAVAALALLDRLRPHLHGARGAAALLAVALLHAGADHFARRQTDASFAPYDASEASPQALSLEKKTRMGLPRAEQVVKRGWDSLGDDPALVRVFRSKAAW